MQRVLIELVVAVGLSDPAVLDEAQQRLPGVIIDRTYSPIPMAVPPQGREIGPSQQIVIIRGTLEHTTADQLKTIPGVNQVVNDAPIAPFEAGGGL